MIKKIKLKSCASCKTFFAPKSTLAKVCSTACAINFVREKKEAEFKLETRKMKAALNENDLSFLADKAQKMFNKFIRLRDFDKPCISCGTTANVKYDAGHYISVGHSSALRFNELNVNKQCSAYCNVGNSSNAVRYRQGLIVKYGAKIVQWLEGPHELKRYRQDDYKNIYKEYKEKCKEYERATKESTTINN